MLSLDELRAEVETGSIDTVVVAFTDMQGRLLGKRLHVEFFLDETDAGHPVEGCNYLLALEMEMDPVPGYEIASWEQGYGDFAIVPDLATLRRIPWLEGTALVLGDVVWHDGSPVAPSPRQVLRAQVERAASLGLTPMLGSELEFFLLKETYAEAHAQGYGRLTPSVPYILDYHILATTYDEPLHPPDPERDARRRDPRRDLEGRGLAGAAGDQLPLRGRAHDGRQPHRLQERRQGDRVPERLLDHLHGEAVRELDRQLVPHPLVALARRASRRSPTTRRCSGTGSPARSPVHGAGALPRADRQLVQALCGRQLGADDARVGERQPHLRVPGRRSRPLAPRGDADPGRRRQPLPGVRGADRGGAPRDRARAASRRRRWRATRTSRTPSASPAPCARRSSALESGTMARAAFGDQVVDHYLNYARPSRRSSTAT